VTPAAARKALALVDDCLFLVRHGGAVRQALKDDDDDEARALSIEKQLRGALGEEWDGRARTAVVDAVAALPKEGSVDAEFVLRQLRGHFDGMEDTLRPIIDRQLRAAYSLGRDRMADHAGIGVDWTLVDRYAQGWLANDTAYWVGQQADEIVGKTVADTIREVVVEQGLSRGEVARVLAERLEPLVVGSRPMSYWETVASAGVVRGRSFGVVETFVEAGVTLYEIVNPMDEATSEICQYLNGQTFEVAAAVGQRDSVLLASDPQEVKKLAPWLPAPNIVGKSVEDLRAAGIALPPYHGNCRSTVVIAAVKAVLLGIKAAVPVTTQKIRQLAARAMNSDELHAFLERPPLAADARPSKRAVRAAERKIVSAELQRRGESVAA